jgi:hypothetical protein
MADRSRRRWTYGLLISAGAFAVWLAALPFDPNSKFRPLSGPAGLLRVLAGLCVLGAVGVAVSDHLTSGRRPPS